jgi:hypothetical protein
LPMITRGCRAPAERRGGNSTLSGSMATRGLRGVMRLAVAAAADGAVDAGAAGRGGAV